MDEQEKQRLKKMKKIGGSKFELALYSKHDVVKRDSELKEFDMSPEAIK